MNALRPVTTIVGVWFIDNMLYDEDGILVVHGDGRVVQFPTSETKPRMDQTMRLWFSEFTGDSVQFSGSPEATGWRRNIEASDTGWDMIADHDGEISRFCCRPADPSKLPDWYSEMLERNLTYLRAPRPADRAEQDSDGKPDNAVS
ncbi:hypothetical protein N9I65_03260 [bacterium]|nr:hypothetical protein [bacterium]